VRNRIVAFTVVILTSILPFFILVPSADPRIPYLKHLTPISIESTPEGIYGIHPQVILNRERQAQFYKDLLFFEAVATFIYNQKAVQTVQTVPTPPPQTVSTPVVNNSGSWTRVAVCEEGGSNSPTFGYFGIMPSSWAAYGGTAYSPTAGGSSWDTQVMIANQISGGVVPDANGCGSW
jgi:Transglycosylase-like domain